MATQKQRRIRGENLNPENPRRITEERLAALGKSLEQFGDLGGITLNRRSEHLIGGHQRVTAFRVSEVKPKITERLKKPDPTGTVAYGYIEMFGTKYSYREVDWDDKTERLAMIAANKQGGEWDDEKLRGVLATLKDAGVNIEESGFDQAAFDALMAAAPVPPTPPPQFPNVGGTLTTEYECPKCQYRWSGKPRPS